MLTSEEDVPLLHQMLQLVLEASEVVVVLVR